MNIEYFYVKDNNAYVKSDFLRIYIPKNYFEGDYPVAEIKNEKISTIGVVYISSSNKKEYSPSEKIFLLKVPCELTLLPRETEEKIIKINGEEVECTILLFEKNDFFMNILVQQTSDFVEMFINKMLHAGKIPSTFGYINIFYFYLEILKFHKVNLKVPHSVLAAIVSELARSKSNKEIRFRNIIGKEGNVSQTDFKLYNIKEIPFLTSNFAAITFEDVNRALQIAVARTKNEGNEIPSPLENVIYY